MPINVINSIKKEFKMCLIQLLVLSGPRGPILWSLNLTQQKQSFPMPFTNGHHYQIIPSYESHLCCVGILLLQRVTSNQMALCVWESLCYDVCIIAVSVAN